MLSALEQIGMKSPPSTAKKTRQMTLETAFSRVNNRNTPSASKDASSTPPSMTTGTSNADNSSELNDDTSKLEDNPRVSAHASFTIDSQDEKSLAGQYLPILNQTHDTGHRDLSRVPTLVDSEDSPSEQLLDIHRSVMSLNEDWDVGAIPGEPPKMSASDLPKSEAQRRVSTRLDILQRASTAVEKTKSLLGKRARETVESGKDQTAALYGMTSSRLRSREPRPQTPASHVPASKKVRLSDTVKPEVKSEPVVLKTKARKLTKTWIDHGLYVGQARDFDPRLTEAQNKKKNPTSRPVKEPFMPLPMYSGQKALEQGRNFRLPFEVFSPLPPGQPKPDEWKKVQKSMFISRLHYCQG